MSSILTRLPRSIKIVVHDGRNLDYRVADTKKSAKTRRWRVIFIGGEKKQATGIIDAQDGFPRWDCEVSITPPKPVDYVTMLVVDGKERHVGQVVIRLTDISPGPAPSLVTSQLHVKGLEETKHNSSPCGQLSFWIWVVEYWPEGTIASSLPLKNSHSFKGSMSQLGMALKPHSSSKSEYDGHSRLGKLRNMKQRVGQRAGSRSKMENSTYSPDRVDNDGSAIMGVGESGSMLSGSHGNLGWASEIGGVSALSGGLGETSSRPPSSSQAATIHDPSTNSYNPLASPEEYDAAPLGDPFAGNNFSSTGKAVSLWTIGPNAAESEVNAPEGSRRKAILNKLKTKVSKSNANISELGSRIRSRRSSPDGGHGETDYSASHGDSPHQARPDNRPILAPRKSMLQLNQSSDLKRSGTMSPSNDGGTPQIGRSEFGLPDTILPGIVGVAKPTGWHVEEGPGKSKAEMSKRELVELSNLLEQRLMTARTELVRANMESNNYQAKIDDLNSELVSARTQLTDLRNRLLEDNMTRYLEVESTSRRSLDLLPSIPHSNLTAPPTTLTNASTTRLDQMKSLFNFGNGNNDGQLPTSTQNSPPNFLSKAKAFAQKPFGQNSTTSGAGTASQPNLVPISGGGSHNLW